MLVALLLALLQICCGLRPVHGQAEETVWPVLLGQETVWPVLLGQETLVTQPFPVDFVYCWAGEKAQRSGGSVDADDNGAGGGWNEMWYSLRSVEKFAPWVNKIYILVNGQDPLPSFVNPNATKGEPENTTKVEMVDRCSLFEPGEEQYCPTHNTVACQAVTHKIKGLSEHYVYMEDVYILKRETSFIDFFTFEGKPLILSDSTDRTGPLYKQPLPSGPDQPPSKVPEAAMPLVPHTAMPLLVSFMKGVQEEYKEWFRFARSHKNRFTCCDAARFIPPGTDEDFSRWLPVLLRQRDVGVLKPVGEYLCDCSPHNMCIDAAFKRDTFHLLLAINHCDSAREARDALTRLHKYLGDSEGVLLVKGSQPQVSDPTAQSTFYVFACLVDFACAGLIVHGLKYIWEHRRVGRSGSISRWFAIMMVASVVAKGLFFFMPRLFRRPSTARDGLSMFCAAWLCAFFKVFVALATFAVRRYREGLHPTTRLSILFARSPSRWSSPAFLLPAVPGIIIASGNALIFADFGSFDPKLAEAFTHLKVLFVGWFWQCIFGRQLPLPRWSALWLYAAAAVALGIDEVGRPAAPSFLIFLVILGRYVLNGLGLVSLESMLKDYFLPVDLFFLCLGAWSFLFSLAMDLIIAGKGEAPASITVANLFTSAEARSELFSDGFILCSIACLAVSGFVQAYVIVESSSLTSEMCGAVVLAFRPAVQLVTGLLDVFGVTGQGALSAAAATVAALLYYGTVELPCDALGQRVKPSVAGLMSGCELGGHLSSPLGMHLSGRQSAEVVSGAISDAEEAPSSAGASDGQPADPEQSSSAPAAA